MERKQLSAFRQSSALSLTKQNHPGRNFNFSSLSCRTSQPCCSSVMKKKRNYFRLSVTHLRLALGMITQLAMRQDVTSLLASRWICFRRFLLSIERPTICFHGLAMSVDLQMRSFLSVRLSLHRLRSSKLASKFSRTCSVTFHQRFIRKNLRKTVKEIANLKIWTKASISAVNSALISAGKINKSKSSLRKRLTST